MTRPTRALISPHALRNNVEMIRRRLDPGTRIMAITKADCYGHGSAICIPELVECGVDLFGVATVEEGIALRELGVKHRVVVLPPPLEGQYELFIRHNLEAAISNPRIAAELADRAAAAGARLTVHMFVDTGMGRNGAPPGDAIETLRYTAGLGSLEVAGFSSHFATSDELANSFTSLQMETFDGVLREALAAGFSFDDIHIANSGGILNFPASHHTVVRPGLALYGYHPTAELQESSGLIPVMSLRTVIANITRMPAGASISYGRRYFTGGDTFIATLPIGYADGLMRILTNRLDVLVGGRRYPVVGTICMDEVMVDLGSDTPVRVGDEAFLIGASGPLGIDAWELAANAGTIPYEICTNVSKRVPRRRNDEI
jgi:alanine racemase